MGINKMSNLHYHLRVKYDMESVELFWKWEFLVTKNDQLLISQKIHS